MIAREGNIGNCHPSKITVNFGFASVDSGFLGVTISKIVSCSQYKLSRMDGNPWTLGFTYTAGSRFPIPHAYMSVEDRCGLPLTCACLLIYHINHQFVQLGRVSGILEKDERIISLQKKGNKQNRNS